MGNIEKNKWPMLQRPPVVVALFQIKFDQGETNLSAFLEYDAQIKKNLPNRSDNVHANIDVPGTIAIGISKITGTSNAEISSHTYSSEDKKSTLTIEQGSIVYQDEHLYQGWENFKNTALYYLEILKPLLENHTVQRISIRFINKFSFDEFDDPTVYFKTMVSTTEDGGFSYPLVKYGFRLIFDIPKADRYAIVNQDLGNQSPNKFDYVFDIDVLERSDFIFNYQTILQAMEELREIKNHIFFDNITSKTIELCN